MFGWLKAKAKTVNCHHTKRFGTPWPDNMVEIARFSPFNKDSIGYGVAQCRGCGKRMFTCITLHAMGPRMSETIDKFIDYKMTEEEFLEFLTKSMAWHQVTFIGEQHAG